MPAPGKSARAALLLGAEAQGVFSWPALAVHPGGHGLHPGGTGSSPLSGEEAWARNSSGDKAPVSSKDESQPP